jgi:hypothetical protein
MASFGLAWIIGHSKLTLPIREMLDDAAEDEFGQMRYFRPAVVTILLLMECPGCLGFHIGWIAHVSGIVHLFPTWYAAALYTCSVGITLGLLTGLVTND